MLVAQVVEAWTNPGKNQTETSPWMSQHTSASGFLLHIHFNQ
ncbi:MAG: hypothetical protein R3B47_17930 [Bacteroidia bacterium]